MRARILSILMTVLMFVALVPAPAMAATFEEVNRQEVFLTQENNGTCTLASTAMMLRRTAMLRGDQDWQSITEASCREAFWIGGRGLPYKFQYDGMKVAHGRLPGGEANRQVLIDMLKAHPEGIVLHAPGVPHAVLLTDYTDGVFYCADPAPNKPNARIPIDQAHGTRIENSYKYWAVTSPDVSLGGPLVLTPDLDEASESAPVLSDLVPAALGTQEAEQTNGCLIAQAMAEAS
jgi:hypothetical protein